MIPAGSNPLAAASTLKSAARSPTDRARLLGLTEIPIIRLTHLSSADKRALALADNKIAELGSWDPDQLKETLTLLVAPASELSFDATITGFEVREIKS